MRGEVFWIGDDRYKQGGKRVGIHGDDGETYWVSMDYVEPTNEPAPVPEGPDPSKGDRVLWKQGEDEGEGTVFWVGEGKTGGSRVGVQCDDGETRWFDARRVTLLAEGGDPPAADDANWDEEDPPF